MPRESLKFLFDARASARAIGEFTADRSLEDYRTDRKLRSAVEREFITIGEALRQAVALDPALRNSLSHVREIVSFRNLLVHGYSGVDDRAVWETAARSLPGLLTELDRLLSEQGSDPVRGALSLLGSIRQAPAACPDTT